MDVLVQTRCVHTMTLLACNTEFSYNWNIHGTGGKGRGVCQELHTRGLISSLWEDGTNDDGAALCPPQCLAMPRADKPCVQGHMGHFASPFCSERPNALPGQFESCCPHKTKSKDPSLPGAISQRKNTVFLARSSWQFIVFLYLYL